MENGLGLVYLEGSSHLSFINSTFTERLLCARASKLSTGASGVRHSTCRPGTLSLLKDTSNYRHNKGDNGYRGSGVGEDGRVF